MNVRSCTKCHETKNQLYNHINNGFSPAVLDPNAAPEATHKGPLTNEDLLGFSLCKCDRAKPGLTKPRAEVKGVCAATTLSTGCHRRTSRLCSFDII